MKLLYKIEIFFYNNLRYIGMSSFNQPIMFGIVSSWVAIIFVILLFQYKFHNKMKQNYLSQAEEIIQLKKEIKKVGFAELEYGNSINSKTLKIIENEESSSNSNKLKYYYQLETLLLEIHPNRIQHSEIGITPHYKSLSHLTNKNVKKLMINNPCGDMLKIVNQFPNIEELIVGFGLTASLVTMTITCKQLNINESDLSYLIYPSKIKKIILVKQTNNDISSVVSYTHMNKEVVVDVISKHYSDIITNYFNEKN